MQYENNILSRLIANKRQLIVALVAALLLLFAVWFISFILTNGRLTITQFSDLKDIKIQRTNSPIGEFTTITDRTSTLPSGDYTLQVNKDGGQYTKMIHVPNLLQTVSITFGLKSQRHVERIASNVHPMLFPLPSGNFASFTEKTEDEPALLHQKDDPFGEHNVINEPDLPLLLEKKYRQNKVLSFTYQDLDHGELQPVLFDILSSKNSVISNQKYELSDHNRPMLLQDNSRLGTSFVIFSGLEEKRFDYYSAIDQAPQRLALPDAPAMNDLEPIASVSGDYVAVMIGNSLAGEIHAEENDELKDNVVYVYSLKDNKEVKKVTLPKNNTITRIAISPDAKYIAYEDNGVLVVASTEATGTNFRLSFNAINRLIWRDNDHLVYSSPEAGIYEIDMSQTSAYPLFGTDIVGITQMLFADNKLYFTGFSSLDSASNETGDGYVIDLDREAQDNNQLVTKLPTRADSYNITSLANNIIIQPYASYNKDENGNFVYDTKELREAEKAARKWLQENLQNADKYTIRVINAN